MTHAQSTTANKTGAASPSSSTAASSTGCGCGCGCHEHKHQNTECCQLTCFERPTYFCGQLLSDADLTLQEKYFREKNKLYHRTMSGNGVVCGLRMRCDGECKGHIMIGDGYAIDCCGNDLVVCEPKTFDVIGELRRKKWLIDIPRELCEPEREEREREERDCLHRQCFYIGICYSEEPAEYVTPYTTNCSPGPGPCQPTRIRESVRFEIYDKLPHRPNPLDEIEKRIECCFRIFRESQFARGLELLAPRILEILDCRRKPETPPVDQEGKEVPREDEHHLYTGRQLFAELRALFLHELRICPDPYNCDLERRAYELRAPAGRDEEFEGPTVLEAFTGLLELVERHVFSCVLGEFAFECPPPDNCCVLIGAVEVENGKLTRVINYPRWYLWCFANFFEVLVYTLANEAACGERPESDSERDDESRKKHHHEGCCPSVEVDVCEFLTLFLAEKRSAEYAARASVQALQAVRRSLVSGFDFMKPHGVSPMVFRNLTADAARALADDLNLNVQSIDDRRTELDPISAMISNLIHRGNDPLIVSTAEGKVTGATRVLDSPALAVGQYDARLEAEARTLGGTSGLLERIRKLEADVEKLRGGSAGRARRRPSEQH